MPTATFGDTTSGATSVERPHDHDGHATGSDHDPWLGRTTGLPLVAPRQARPGRWWSLPTHAGLLTIHAYRRFVSPRFPARCRYEPTCSAYALDAVRAFGLMEGARLAVARVRRCTRHVPCRTPDPLVVG